MVVKKVTIFGVPYSPNLGDGAIGYCLALLIKNILGKKTIIKHIDFAGREENKKFLKNKKGIRELFIKCARFVPSKLRSLLVKSYLRKSLKPKLKDWRNQIIESDFIVIGGGNLFSDIDLNFPLKLSTVLEIAVKEEKKIFITSVGVNDNWSPGARKLIEPYLSYEKLYFSCRDRRSCELVKKIFGDRPVHLLPDPVLLASELHQPSERINKIDNRIGINIACPTNLSYSGDVKIPFDENLHLNFYKKLIFGFLKRGYQIELFTNGAIEDRLFLSKFLKLLDPNVRNLYISQPKSPQELIDAISVYDKLFSFRMHACIIGLSYKIPSFSIAWDSKINSFFFENNINDFLFDSSMINTGSVGAKKILNKNLCTKQINPSMKDTIRDSYLSFFKENL